MSSPAQPAAAETDPTPPPRHGAPAMIARVEDGVGWMIYSNTRRRNAITLDMWSAIPAIIARFEADPAVNVVALRGDGHAAFVSGADISEFDDKRSSPEQVARYDETAEAASSAIANLRKPSVAVIEGWCVGGGLGTALSCDLRFASDTSRFMLPAAKLGLGYRFDGVRALVATVGAAKAKEIFFTARQYDAHEAMALGIVNRIAPQATFEDDVRDYLGSIAAGAPLTIQSAKLSIDAAVVDREERDMAAIDASVDRCFASEDYREGRRAFAQKRRPAFTGR